MDGSDLMLVDWFNLSQSFIKILSQEAEKSRSTFNFTFQ